jgi:hypothetical protein
LFVVDPKLDAGTSGMKGFNEFVFEVAGEDKPTIPMKLLCKRPK